MIKKIIFLLAEPLTQRHFERFGIELLMENGFQVEVWDLSCILRPGFRERPGFADPIGWRHRTFKEEEKREALNEIKAISAEALIVVVIHYLRERYSLWKAISLSEAEYAVCAPDILPLVENSKRQSLLLYLQKLQRVTVKKLLDYGFLRLPFAWLGIKPARLIIAGGRETLKYHFPANRATQILWTHAMDYDLYLKERQIPTAERPVAIFLDQYTPFHPDPTYRGIARPISADKYYPLLKNFFKFVEDQLGLEVIIAAHPHSRYYEEHPDYFEGRKCIKGQTARLIKESRLILAHSTTAVNLANLFYKPIVFLTSRELDRSYKGSHIRAMAGLFGKRPIFIDGDSSIDWKFELTVNRECYHNYRQAYIKTDTSLDLPFWQIVANRLKEGYLCRSKIN